MIALVGNGEVYTRERIHDTASGIRVGKDHRHEERGMHNISGGVWGRRQ